MASYCRECGTPLPIDTESDRCWQHGGPALKPESQIRCPFCKELILAEAKKCRFCGEFLSGPVAPVSIPSSLPKATPSYPYGAMYCTSCGGVGTPRGMNKLELIVVLIVSLFTLFIPLMIYLFVRSGKRCRKCGKKSLIPLSSPVARAALESSTTNTQAVPAAAAPTVTRPSRPDSVGTKSTPAAIGNWMARHPIWTILIILFVIGSLSEPFLNEKSQPVGEQKASEANVQAQPPLNVPVPKFRVYRSRRDEMISYTVPVETSDDQLKSLLWFFREKVRTGSFKEIMITQPTAKQWGVDGYNSGMLLVFRGTKCASEPYFSLDAAEKGNLGPCGYGEHDDALYQWGIDADKDKDSGEIRDRNGNTVVVFDYKDNWRPPTGSHQ